MFGWLIDFWRCDCFNSVVLDCLLCAGFLWVCIFALLVSSLACFGFGLGIVCFLIVLLRYAGVCLTFVCFDLLACCVLTCGCLCWWLVVGF